MPLPLQARFITLTLSAAADVNRVMSSHRFTDKLQREWELLRVDLNALAGIYSLSPL